MELVTLYRPIWGRRKSSRRSIIRILGSGLRYPCWLRQLLRWSLSLPLSIWYTPTDSSGTKCSNWTRNWSRTSQG